MALPEKASSYDEMRSNLIYFLANLAAVQEFQDLAQMLREGLDALRAARNAGEDLDDAEIVARANRDRIDDQGDQQVIDWRNELAGTAGQQHVVLQTLFPEGVRALVRPRGTEQERRLRVLLADIDTALALPALRTDPKKEKIEARLAEGKTLVAAAVERLAQANATQVTAERAADQGARELLAAKGHAVDVAGQVLGTLRARLGGSQAAALGYTKPAESRRKQPAPPPATEPGAPLPA